MEFPVLSVTGCSELFRSVSSKERIPCDVVICPVVEKVKKKSIASERWSLTAVVSLMQVVSNKGLTLISLYLF